MTLTGLILSFFKYSVEIFYGVTVLSWLYLGKKSYTYAPVDKSKKLRLHVKGRHRAQFKGLNNGNFIKHNSIENYISYCKARFLSEGGDKQGTFLGWKQLFRRNPVSPLSPVWLLSLSERYLTFRNRWPTPADPWETAWLFNLLGDRSQGSSEASEALGRLLHSPRPFYQILPRYFLSPSTQTFLLIIIV